jgi:hypothetical protein
MKKTNSYGAMPVLFRIAFFLLISLSLFLFFGCEEDELEEDKDISEITITNLPASIPLANGSGSNIAFKIYLNASDSQDPTVPPVAKGVAKFSDGTLKGEKYSIKIKLQKPNPKSKKDPNLDTGSWSGTANYFSVMISPQSVAENGQDAVWIKAGMTLDKGKKEYSWDKLIDFRNSTLVNPDQAEALYKDIILEDPDITKQ